MTGLLMKKYPSTHLNKGFTLIEVMIVVLIIALLISIALPNYTQYITRANRTDAKDKLTEIALEQERFNTRNRQYTIDLTDLGYPGESADGDGAGPDVRSDDGFYDISAEICEDATIRTCVNLTATPVEGGRQARDGELTLSTRGQKTGKWDK